MNNRRCKRCRELKPSSAFSVTPIRGTLSWNCLPCQAAAEAKRAAIRAQWHAANRETMRQYREKWRLENPALGRARTARYEAAKRRAMPAWADKDAIDRLYQEAVARTAETGIPHEVDHIVPLQSEIVCGLHWEANLRVLPRMENILKSNRHWPGMP